MQHQQQRQNRQVEDIGGHAVTSATIARPVQKGQGTFAAKRELYEVAHVFQMQRIGRRGCSQGRQLITPTWSQRLGHLLRRPKLLPLNSCQRRHQQRCQEPVLHQGLQLMQQCRWQHQHSRQSRHQRLSAAVAASPVPAEACTAHRACG